MTKQKLSLKLERQRCFRLFSVHLSKNAEKYLSKLDLHISEQITKGLLKLKSNPIPTDSKPIGRHQGDMVFRFRIGVFRVLYKVKQQDNVVLVSKIDKRPRVYK